jgi:tetrahydromethanopterin S-methyltransferase subunit F
MSELSLGIIIGIIIGLVTALVIMVFVWWLWGRLP